MSKNKKISLETVKKLPHKTLMRLINKAKKHLIEDEVWIKICKEYNQDPSIINFIPTMFGDLDVSAKTDHGVVILNYQLLCDGDFFKDYSYLIHEFTHVFQQFFNDKPTKSHKDVGYLDNKHEQEGFTNQVEYISNQFGEDEAEEYVDKLLDHHEIKSKKKQDELESIFFENV